MTLHDYNMNDLSSCSSVLSASFAVSLNSLRDDRSDEVPFGPTDISISSRTC